MASSLTNAEIECLRAVFRRYDAIQAVYLFGSYAEGRARENSDLDLAVVLHREVQGRPDLLDVLTDLVTAGFENVDLVFLDEVDLIVQYEAIRNNNVIYQTEGFERGALYSLIVRKYLDIKPLLDRQRNAYKQRILHGQA